MSVDRKVEQILSTPGEDEQQAKLLALTEELLSSQAASQLTQLFNRLLAVDVPQSMSKKVAFHFANGVKHLGSDAMVAVGLGCISAIKDKTNTSAFDETDAVLRHLLFDYYLSVNEMHDAALTLAGLRLDSAALNYSPMQKADTLIKVAECYLMTKDTIEAEIFSNKAAEFMGSVEQVLRDAGAGAGAGSTDSAGGAAAAADKDKEKAAETSEALALQLRYRAAMAQIMDGNRKFVEAAFRYYELSRLQSSLVAAEDLLQLLGKAVTCAILGDTGTHRTRVLGLLANDDRLEQLSSLPQFAGHASLLLKVQAEQLLLNADEVAAFEASVDPHQKALTADGGLNIVEKAVMEHNLTATARVYSNVRLAKLAHILRLSSADQAEQVAARLISKGRLNASIDQTAGVLYFLEDTREDGEAAVQTQKIRAMCNEVSACAEMAKEITLVN